MTSSASSPSSCSEAGQIEMQRDIIKVDDSKRWFVSRVRHILELSFEEM